MNLILLYEDTVGRQNICPKDLNQNRKSFFEESGDAVVDFHQRLIQIKFFSENAG